MILFLKVIIAGAWSALTQGLWSEAVSIWHDDQTVQARRKYDFDPSFHLLKNIGQEWTEDTIRREPTEKGKMAYKIAALLIVAAALISGLVVGTVAFIIAVGSNLIW